jgi:hypothetical protein
MSRTPLGLHQALRRLMSGDRGRRGDRGRGGGNSGARAGDGHQDAAGAGDGPRSGQHSDHADAAAGRVAQAGIVAARHTSFIGAISAERKRGG